MKTATKGSLYGLFGVMILNIAAPISASADSQSNKNLWRNLAAGSGAIAANGLLHGNGTETLLGLGGAAYSGSRYEQERKSQDQSAREHRDYHHRYASNSDRKYYWYNGHEYYLNRHTGNRYEVQ